VDSWLLFVGERHDFSTRPFSDNALQDVELGDLALWGPQPKKSVQTGYFLL